MKIAVIGTGYVGLVTGVGLAELGNNVVCADIDEKKIAQLHKSIVPIYEPGLEELMLRNIKENRLTFTTNSNKAIKDAEIVFSAVGTPMGESYQADLQYVKAVADTFAKALNGYKVLVTKSTVPVGTGEMLSKRIKKITKQPFDIVSNPEFLREGNAVSDFLQPDRIVVGVNSKKAEQMMQKLYRPLTDADVPMVVTDIKSAELIKYAANSMLATRISFMNEIARFCDLVGADVKEVSRGVGLDNRIGPAFLQAGIGYGGSCFPKDVMALVASGEQNGLDFEILKAAHKVNDHQFRLVIDKLVHQLNDLKGKKIAVWGLSFKPNTDDVRDAPAKPIIEELLKLGAKVSTYDPVAIDEFSKSYGLDIKYANDQYAATEDADALLLLTEWDEFKTLNFDKLSKMKNKIIIDGRNVYDPVEMKQANFVYESIGRPS